MSNKPKIYGYCPAGCKWETVHKDDFLNSASVFEMTANVNGRFELEIGKTYKLLENGSTFNWNGKIAIYDPNNSSSAVALPFPTKTKFHNGYNTIKLLGYTIENGKMCLNYVFNGENKEFRLQFDESTVLFIDAYDFKKCFIVNEDAKITLEANKIKSSALIGQDENGGNIYELTFGNGEKTRFIAPKGIDGVILNDGDNFGLAVDEKGDLYIYTKDGNVIPDIEYDEETGDLFHVLNDEKEGTVKKLIGNLRSAIINEDLIRQIVDEYVSAGTQVDLGNYYTKNQTDSKFATKNQIPSLDGYAKTSDLEDYVKKDEIPNNSSVDEDAVREIVQDYVYEKVNTNFRNYYTKPQSDEMFATKDQVNNMVTAPSNGFFTLFVDTKGDLWLYSTDGKSVPALEYDAKTGNFYFKTEVDDFESYADEVRY